MEHKKIFLASPHMSDEEFEMKYIKEAFDTNWIAPLGANVDGFEREFCEFVGTKSATALSSGTAALHLALKLSNVNEGDKVFCQSLTFSATANPIMYEKCVPVFIDSEIETWNMSTEALKKAFKKYPETKVVILVHLYGIPANIQEIVNICKENNAILIEDAAESLGSTYNGKHTGTFGDFGICSFNGNKIITTSGGGMLFSSREDAEEKMKKAKFYSTQSKEAGRYYEHKEIGFNYRISNISAGIGRGQLRILNERVRKKQEIFSYYKNEFADINEINMMPVGSIEKCNCWLSTFLLRADCNVKPIDIILELEKSNIEARHTWKPMHMQPVFDKFDYIDNGGISEDIFNRGICLPSDTKMTIEEQQRVISIIKKMF